MPLTAEEQAELAKLEGKFSNKKMSPMEKFSGRPEMPVFDTDAQGAARAGAVQGLTLGYAPNIAGLGAVIGGKDYTQARDQYGSDIEQAKAKNPLAGFIGNLVGGGATASLAAPQAAGSALGRVGQAIGVGAGFGAAANPGNVPGKITPVQASDRIQNAATGGIVGGVMGGGSEIGKKAWNLGKDAVGYVSGFSHPETDAFMKDPALVQSLSKDLPAQQQYAASALDSARNSLRDKSNILNESANASLSDFRIPENKVSGAQAVLSKIDKPMMVDSGTGQIYEGELRRGLKALGDQQYVKNPITGANIGKDPEISAAYGQLRSALPPEAQDSLSGMKDIIDIQKGIKQTPSPIAFMARGRDAAANRASVDNALGNTDLSNSAATLGAAEETGKGGLRRYLGRLALRGGASVQDAASAAPSAPTSAGTLSGLISQTSPNLTKDEQDELHRLEQKFKAR